MTAPLTPDELARLELLRRSSSYPDHPDAVEQIETHLSWVFLTDRFAYKLKKPVRFDFLDYTSHEQRHQACEEELRLNRRLAPDVYLAVLPITRSARGRLQLDGGGTPVDWVLKMRRLPRERSLRHLLVSGRLGNLDVGAVAEQLALYYSQQPPLTVQPDSYRRQLTQQLRTNLSDLLAHLPDQVVRINQIHAAQLEYVARQARQFDQRVCDGRLIDGHGDLRPDHVFVLSPPVVIDGIEFARKFRQIDIAEELSALVMECEQLGCSEVGQALLERYTTLTSDRPSEELLAFYKSCRAGLRARFQALRAQQEAPPCRAVFLQQAETYLSRAAGYLDLLPKPEVEKLYAS